MATDPASRSAARTIAALVLALMILGYVANFPLIAPVIAAPGFLVNAALHPASIGLAALLILLMGILSLAMSIVAFPVLDRGSRALAIWFVALSAAGLALAALEGAALLSLLSLSEAYAKAAASQQGQFEAMRSMAAASRNWTHYIHLIVGGATLFAFYLALFRARLVPRWLGALGMLAAVSQMCAVALPLFGMPVNFAMIAPLGLSQALLALWLIFKGFRATAPG